MEFDYSLYYNKSAGADFPAAHREAKRYIRQLAPYLPIDKTMRILEIGPGNGLVVKQLMEMGYTGVVGWETDSQLALAANKKGAHVEHIVAGDVITKLASEKESYALIFCMHVIEHIPKDQQLLFMRSVSQSLKKDGHFICETPNALSPTANYWQYNDVTHVTCFTPLSLIFLYESHGLHVLYAGNALEGEPPPRGGFIVSTLKTVAECILKFLSRSIYRIHYVAEFGFAGFHLPLHKSLLIIGKK